MTLKLQRIHKSDKSYTIPKMELSTKIFLLVLCAFVTISASPTQFLIRNPSQSGPHSVTQHRIHCHGVRYRGLGCFSLDPPFNNTNWLPQRPSFVDTAFMLYTRDNRVVPEILQWDERTDWQNSHFKPHRPVKFLIHGFLQHGTMDFLVNMTQALLNKASMNVIVVGWGRGAWFPYTQAVANTRLIGAETTRLVRKLLRETGVTKNQIHLIGHSLGAHIAGYVGSGVPGLGRITGLDPAQPNYAGFLNEVTLDRSDALFVDVIHTDAQEYDTVRGYGMIEPVGHIDFYPNGGKNQPGCHDESSIFGFVEDAFSNGMSVAEESISCSHERSTALFTASVIQSTRSGSHCSFQAIPCSSDESFLRGECLDCGNRPCPVMGFDANLARRSPGVFFLNTTETPSFCAFHYFVTLKIDSSMTYADGDVKVKVTGRDGSLLWSVVKSGRINGGDVLTHLVLGETNIGDITRVDVRFDHNPGYFSWGEDLVQLDSVKVDSLMRSPTKYFCSSSMTVHNAQDLILTTGSFTDERCL